MSSPRRRGVFPVLALVVAMMALIAGQAAAKPGNAGPPDPPASSQAAEHRPACGPVPQGYARCHARVVTNSKGGKPGRPTTTTPGPTTPTTTGPTTTLAPTTTAAPTTTTTLAPTTTTTIAGSGCTTAHGGLTPCDLIDAYNLPAGGSGKTIAIVDAYDDPNAEADMGVYRAAYGLPPCTTANGCFHKVNQNGGSTYPAPNAGWAEEIALDLDMASAICPGCNILLVEATSNSLANLGIAVNRAATMGATAISNSYGANEFSTETNYESYYNHPGIAITVSSGDSGYGVQFPAVSQYVTAVGGTSLTRNASDPRGWTETVWSGAGSGCSAYITKPGWQADACPRRTVADVSAVANPSTGVAVYNTYGGDPGWMVFGGTSVAAPIIAGVYALSGNTGGVPASLAYSHTSSLFDIVSGSNGNCGGSYLCTGKVGYDGPTGLGTPNGVGAF